MKKNQIDIITLGCSKNLVDSELLMKQFEANGYHCVHDSKRPQGEIAVINTCGFIEDAKQESIDTILEFIQAKEEGRLRKLYVMGCLSQRYQKELEKGMHSSRLSSSLPLPTSPRSPSPSSTEPLRAALSSASATSSRCL